ncbi:organic cation transporter protein-like [Cotesia typhae]|uniref:organic cation transporter protein-like n=1 Tax=Cotesia typhae TaxID=2053667 RepID=UPI003D693F94
MMKGRDEMDIKKRRLLQAIDQLEEGSTILWILLIMNLSTTLLFGINSMSYVFISEVPKYWCSNTELVKANWTIDQINNITAVDDCHAYKYNYTYLANKGYDKVLQYVKDVKFLPSVGSCTSFTFDESKRSTIVSEWSLVCDRKLYRANTFLVYSLGILAGSGLLGTYADKYGRKNSLIISIIFQVIAGPASALVPWFWAYSVFRFFTGLSVGAMYSSAFTILSEIAKGSRRKLFAAGLDASYSVGTFFLIGMAYALPNWRHLQLAMSCFILPMIVLIWWIPESPRWLISQNRYDEAEKIIKKYCKSFVTTQTSTAENQTNDSTLSSSESCESCSRNQI